MTIDVQEELKPKPGKCLVVSLVGPTEDIFEIYTESEQPASREAGEAKYIRYYVNRTMVDRQTYRDCLETSALDRYDVERDVSETTEELS